MNETRNVLLGSRFSTRKQRRIYVALMAAAMCGVFSYALLHPTARIAQVILASSIFWMQSIGTRRRWDPTVPIPENERELKSSDVTTLQAYRLLTFLVFIAAAGVGALCLTPPYAHLETWHSLVGISLYGLAVLTVNLPKALVIWEQPD